MRKRKPKKQGYAFGTPRRVLDAFSDLEKQIIRERLSIDAPTRERQRYTYENVRISKTPTAAKDSAEQ